MWVLRIKLAIKDIRKKEQPGLLTTKPLLQPPCVFLWGLFCVIKVTDDNIYYILRLAVLTWLAGPVLGLSLIFL